MEQWKLLLSVSGEAEAGIVTNILKNHDIAFITKDAAAIGGFMKIYSGHSIYGTDIYVKDSQLNAAKDYIYNFLPDESSDAF